MVLIAARKSGNDRELAPSVEIGINASELAVLYGRRISPAVRSIHQAQRSLSNDFAHQLTPHVNSQFNRWAELALSLSS
jgi:hypothetical protein